VSSTKGGKKVIESDLVGQVDDGKARTPPETVAVEEIIVAYGQIEKIA
jgi:hypothetical protein